MNTPRPSEINSGNSFLRFLRLDSAPSDFEKSHLRKIHFAFLLGLIGHVPLMLATAWYFGTGLSLAAGLSLLILSGPLLFYQIARTSRWTSVVMAVALISMSALLIHLGRGMIEMHFHIFVSLALVIVFGNPLVVLAAAGAAAVHHLAFFFFLPSSVFNYQASLGIVILHAAFVVAETIPSCWIAKIFGNFISAQALMRETLLKTAHEIRGNSQSLVHTSEKLSSSVSRQVTSLQSSADSLRRMNNVSEKAVESANLATQTSTNAKSFVTDGLHIVSDMLNSFGQIEKSNESVANQVGESFKQFETILGVIKNIEDKTRVINDIVFQTKLLSFNASVEAARAGEHGKGFAVVAEEIGNLASMSGQSAADISKLLSESTAQVQEILKANQDKVKTLVEQSITQLRSGREVAKKCGNSFEEISQNIFEVSERMGVISSSGVAQKDGLNQMTASIESVEKEAEGNQELAQVTFSAANSLLRSADSFEDVLSEVLRVIGSDEEQNSKAA